MTTDKLLDKDPLREGLTALLLAWRAMENQLAELRQEVARLRDRVEILEVRQAGRDRLN